MDKEEFNRIFSDFNFDHLKEVKKDENIHYIEGQSSAERSSIVYELPTSGFLRVTWESNGDYEWIVSLKIVNKCIKEVEVYE